MSGPSKLGTRLVLSYLASGLAVVLTFLVGVTIALCVPYQDAENDQALRRLEEYRRELPTGNKAALQKYVERRAHDPNVIYCGITDENDVLIAHSRRNMIGRHAPEDRSSPVDKEMIRRVQTVGENAQALVEYRIPLNETNRAAFILGMIPTPPEHRLNFLTETVHPVLIAPLLVVCSGVWMMRRAMKPMAEIERQLGRFAAEDAPDLKTLVEIDDTASSSVGWNRLVALTTASRAPSDGDDQIPVIIERRRTGKDRSILQSLPDGIAVTDGQGVITFANNAFLAMGRLENVVGTTMESLLRKWGVENDNSTDNGSHWTTREVRVTFDGDERVLRVSRNQLLGDRSVGGDVWSIRDVTQQKLAEEMRNQFVFAATHELRTPLANIRAYAETLELNSLADPEQQKSFLNVITTEATRLARFVDELLNISRMEAGSVTLERAETDVERLCREIADTVRPQMDQKRIQFAINVAPKLPKLSWDKDKMASAIVNVLGNAAKYTPEDGRVSLNVATTASGLEISVEDSGIGISAEELPKVFDKFFRSDDPRIREIPGSGLGLAFTQEVTRLHGGKMAVHSEINKGTKFTLTLPLR